jgi:hypothetical protein
MCTSYRALGIYLLQPRPEQWSKRKCLSVFVAHFAKKHHARSQVLLPQSSLGIFRHILPGHLRQNTSWLQEGDTIRNADRVPSIYGKTQVADINIRNADRIPVYMDYVDPRHLLLGFHTTRWNIHNDLFPVLTSPRF